MSLDLHTVKYEPLFGSSDIPLPAFLAAKKAMINLKYEDDECSKWAITRALNPAEKHAERNDQKLRDTSEVLNSEELKFPVILININKFENHNFSISVNVFGYEKLVYPLKIYEQNYKRESTVNLQLISDETKQHYCWINDMSKVLYLQALKLGRTRHVYFRCLNILNSKDSLASHHEYCKSHEAIKIELPEEESKTSFKNHNRSMRVSFIVYTDFEFFTPQLSTCQPNPEKSYTNQYQKHVSSKFCNHIKCFC